MINNVATAANGVVIKKKLDSKELGTWGLMFYNTVGVIRGLKFRFLCPTLEGLGYLTRRGG